MWRWGIWSPNKRRRRGQERQKKKGREEEKEGREERRGGRRRTVQGKVSKRKAPTLTPLHPLYPIYPPICIFEPINFLLSLKHALIQDHKPSHLDYC